MRLELAWVTQGAYLVRVRQETRRAPRQSILRALDHTIRRAAL